MASLTDSIIVLNTTKVGEKSLVVHSLSSSMGRRSFITTAGRGSGALYMPLNILDVQLTENPRSDLWRMGGVSAKYALNGIRSDVKKNAISMFMSEVLYRTVRDGAYEEGLFEWCERSVLTLDALGSDYGNYHLLFLLELASALGFSPTVQDMAPFAGDRLPEVRALMCGSFSESMLVPLSGAVRSEIAGLILDYLSVHTESKIEIRSLRVLSELFR